MRIIQITVFTILISLFFGSTIANADCYDFQEYIVGKSYEIVMDENVFNLSFDLESLSNCPKGKVILKYDLIKDGWTKSIELDFNFTTNNVDGYLLIQGLGICFFANEKMYLTPSDIPMVIMNKVYSSIKFPW